MSKISYAEDLARVVSLSFRGEALHTISTLTRIEFDVGYAAMRSEHSEGAG
jgi:DNA mismatch repair ATPase MutL